MKKWGNGKDPKDVEFNWVARLTYKVQRYEQKQPVIEHQITCERFLMRSIASDSERARSEGFAEISQPSHQIFGLKCITARQIRGRFGTADDFILISFVRL